MILREISVSSDSDGNSPRTRTWYMGLSSPQLTFESSTHFGVTRLGLVISPLATLGVSFADMWMVCQRLRRLWKAS